MHADLDALLTAVYVLMARACSSLRSARSTAGFDQSLAIYANEEMLTVHPPIPSRRSHAQS